jgi:hypothetical protein
MATDEGDLGDAEALLEQTTDALMTQVVKADVS